MNGNVACTIIFLILCGIVSSNPDRAIDCRKFVFAPLCRGVAAKRQSSTNDYNEPTIYIDEKSLREILKSMLAKSGVTKSEDHEDSMIDKSTGKQEDVETLAKKYEHERENRFFRLLPQSRKVSSDRNFGPVLDYDTL